MSKVKEVLVALLILGLMGCAITPPPKPIDPHRAVIGISVKNRAPIRMITQKNDKVYFIKVDEGEDSHIQVSYVESNYSKGGQVYLLNVQPGRYAAVASSYKRMGGQYTTFFSEELIKLTEVLVTAETMAFIGEYVVDSSMGEEEDDAQKHYSQLISRISSGWSYKGSLHERYSDKQTEIKFLTNALKQLKGTDWTNIIQKRIEDLEAER